MQLRAFWDIGGAGAKGDATSIWIVQWVGQQINVLDYIEGVGQPLSFYVNELRAKSYQNALCVLPHDGVAANVITGKRYEDHVREAGFQVHVIKNQGAGAANMRIEAVRRILPSACADQFFGARKFRRPIKQNMCAPSAFVRN